MPGARPPKKGQRALFVVHRLGFVEFLAPSAFQRLLCGCASVRPSVRASAGPGVPQTCANRILGVPKNLLPSSKFLSARVSGRPDGLQTCANSILNPFQNQVCRRLQLHALASEAGRAASRRAQTTFSERLRMEFVNVCGLKMNARISTKIAFVDDCGAFILAHRRDAGTGKLSAFVDGGWTQI